MEIREKRQIVSVGGLASALIWLLIILPLAIIFFGVAGLIGAVLLAILMRALSPKKFEVVKPDKKPDRAVD